MIKLLNPEAETTKENIEAIDQLIKEEPEKAKEIEELLNRRITNLRKRMNKTKIDHILACVAEECGEVQQIVGKSLRFGLDSSHPDNPAINNMALLHSEMIDIIAVYEMLCDECNETPIATVLTHHSYKQDKRKKVNKLYDVFHSNNNQG